MSAPSLILYPFSDPAGFDAKAAAKLVFHLVKNGISHVDVGLASVRLDEPAYLAQVQNFLKVAADHGVAVSGIVLQDRFGDLYDYMVAHAFDHDANGATWTSWLQSHFAAKELANLASLPGLDGVLFNNETLSAIRTYFNGTALPQASKDLAIAYTVAIYRDYIDAATAVVHAVLPQADVATINPWYLDAKASNVGAADYWPGGATQGFIDTGDGLLVDVRIGTLTQWDYRNDGLDVLASVIVDRVLWYGNKTGTVNNYGPLLDSYFSGLNKPITIEISDRVYDPLQPGFEGLTAADLRTLETLVEQAIIAKIRALEQTVPGFNSATIDEIFVRDHLFAGVTMVVPGADGLSSLDRFYQAFPATNQAPVATNDNVKTLPGVAVTIDPLANDRDPDGFALFFDGAGAPRNGTVQVDPVTGKLVYVPNFGFSGTDSFTYTISDGIDTATGQITVDTRRSNPMLTLDPGSGQEVINGKKITIATGLTALNAGVMAMEASGGTLKATTSDGFGVSGPGDSAALSRQIDGGEALLLKLDPNYAAQGPAIGMSLSLRGVDSGDVLRFTGYVDANHDGVLSAGEIVGVVQLNGGVSPLASGSPTFDLSFLSNGVPAAFDAVKIEAIGAATEFSVFGAKFYGTTPIAVAEQPAALTTAKSVAMTIASTTVTLDGTRFSNPTGNALETPRLDVEGVNGTFKVSAGLLGIQSGANAADRWGDTTTLSKMVNGDEVIRFVLANPQAADILQAKIGFGGVADGDVILARGYSLANGKTLVGEMLLDVELAPGIDKQSVRIGFQDATHAPLGFDSLELSAVGLNTEFTIADATFYLS